MSPEKVSLSIGEFTLLWIRKTWTVRNRRPKKTLNFCDRVLQRRNCQLHGGDDPFDPCILQSTLATFETYCLQAFLR